MGTRKRCVFFDSSKMDDDALMYDKFSTPYHISEGIIIAFADLGFWHGRYIGTKIYNTDITSLIYNGDSIDYCIIFSKNKQICGTLRHHDGEHHLTYRIAKDRAIAKHIANLANEGKLTREYFMRHTKSLYDEMMKFFFT